MDDVADSVRQATADALTRQAIACLHLGSDIYWRILLALHADHGVRGVTAAILDGASTQPVHDAVVLRMLSSVHRMVLRGEAPGLARHYPSAGGLPGPGLEEDFLAILTERLDDVRAEMDLAVQTNETGRSVVAAAIHSWVGSRGVEALRWLEIGASAGLNLNYARYEYAGPTGPTGSVGSRLAIGEDWSRLPFDVRADRPRLVDIRGTDPSPLDPVSPTDALRLESYVWPDHEVRRRRLRAAMAIASDHPVVVDTESGDTWIERMTSTACEGATVVFHSVVWQYLPPSVRDGVRAALDAEGGRTNGLRRLFWARMEPAGAVADVRVDEWTNGTRTEHLLATVGFHGQNLDWR